MNETNDTLETKPGKLDALFSSATVEWATPQAFFDALDREFGFVLDVCANTENTKCDAYFSKRSDGLRQDWAKYAKGFGGAVWMNPPYGREIGAWVEKAVRESRAGATVVCLLPARTDVAWFHEFIWDAGFHRPRPGVEVRFVRGRLKFGGSKNSAPFPSVVVVFRLAR